MLVAGALIIAGFSSCTKKDYKPISQTNSQRPVQAKIDLVATEWTVDDGGVYESTFQNILSNSPITNGSRVRVFVKEGSEPILISGAAVMFMDHPLWASTTQNDVTIGYSCPEVPMPFQTLHIEVVVD